MDWGKTLALVACFTPAMLAMLAMWLIGPSKSPEPPACADIPAATARHMVVRDGQVECHYHITILREKK